MTLKPTRPILNIYCDESCHLEKDGCPVMVLGAITCPAERAAAIAVDLRAIKERFAPRSRTRPDHPDAFEVKWTKVGPGRQAFYLALVNYFLDQEDLAFRAVIIPDKSKLRHGAFGQDHDTFYYKMQFRLIEFLLRPRWENRIYLDIKDTRSAAKMAKLHEVLCSSQYDHIRETVSRVQTVRSHEVEQLQLADLLIGAVSYANRGLTGNAGKLAVIERLRQRTGLSLTASSLVRETKFNLFRWQAQ